MILYDVIDKLDKLNTITKYPSIRTYHQLGERGRLLEEVQCPVPQGEKLYVTEKINGRNARIIFLEDGTQFIGSRDLLLHYSSDVIYNPIEGIVSAITQPQRVLELCSSHIETHLIVAYVEVYGGTQKMDKEYTKLGKTNFRVFDIASIPYTELKILLDLSLAQLAGWRDSVGLTWQTTSSLYADELDDSAPVSVIRPTPLLDIVFDFPTTLNGVSAYLNTTLPHRNTKCGIDVVGKSEGIVVRNESRSFITKIRFDEYIRTLNS